MLWSTLIINLPVFGSPEFGREFSQVTAETQALIIFTMMLARGDQFKLASIAFSRDKAPSQLCTYAESISLAGI